MKTSIAKVTSLLSTVVFIAALLPACSQNGGEAHTQFHSSKPKIDLQTAVASGNLEVVKQHIEAGTNIDKKEPFGGSTPLIAAATFDKVEIAKALIDAGANLSLKNNEGSTALHTAAFFCRVEIVKLLLEANADKTLRNNFGATPRETVMASYADMKPFYELIGKQLAPLGLQLDFERIERTRPMIAEMLQ